jgi:predicted tellurium resistance membrane protein TerC
MIFKKETRAEAIIGSLKQQGSVKTSVTEYLLLSPLAIVGFVFTGSGITATFSAFSNAFYSIKFVYLLVLVTVIPLGNVLFLALKPENLCKTKRGKLVALGSALAVNLVFAALFLVCELAHPDFLVHVGKPLFLIAFSVSMPVEPAVLLAVMAISSVIYIWRIALALRKNDN